MNKSKWVSRFIEAEKLPAKFADIADQFFIPFAENIFPIIQAHRLGGTPLVIGVNGAQGTGKTTFAKFLSGYLTDFHNLNGAQFSLDDFYLTRAERARRAIDIHPLFLTRGVPGTHDTDMAIAIIEGLQSLKSGDRLALPRFDKSIDERKRKEDWPVVNGEQDFLIFEGWCVGSQPVNADDLVEPLNDLEKIKDVDGVWRHAVNEFLRRDYQRLFAMLDCLVFLKAPNFEAVLGWRSQQESQLALNKTSEQSRIMSEQDLAIFIQHYERITRRNLERIPAIADHIFEFDRNHRISSWINKA